MEETNRTLRGISGESLDKLSKKWVNYKVVAEGGQFMNVATKFLVSDYASKNVLSAGKLRATGFTVVMSNEGNYLVHPNFAYKIPPFLRSALESMEQSCRLEGKTSRVEGADLW